MLRVDAASLDQLFHARIDPNEKYRIAGKGLNASPGAATGQIVFDADKAERIRNLILPSESIPYARARARNYIDQARRALSSLPDSEAKSLLDAMAEFVITRPL